MTSSIMINLLFSIYELYNFYSNGNESTFEISECILKCGCNTEAFTHKHLTLMQKMKLSYLLKVIL